jgi:hypothetical protein
MKRHGSFKLPTEALSSCIWLARLSCSCCSIAGALWGPTLLTATWSLITTLLVLSGHIVCCYHLFPLWHYLAAGAVMHLRSSPSGYHLSAGLAASLFNCDHFYLQLLSAPTSSTPLTNPLTPCACRQHPFRANWHNAMGLVHAQLLPAHYQVKGYAQALHDILPSFMCLA